MLLDQFSISLHLLLSINQVYNFFVAPIIFFFLKLFNAQTIFQLIFLTEVTLHVEKPCRVVICRTQKVFGHLFSSTHDSVETTAICETKTKLCSEIVSISFFYGDEVSFLSSQWVEEPMNINPFSSDVYSKWVQKTFEFFSRILAFEKIEF